MQCRACAKILLLAAVLFVLQEPLPLLLVVVCIGLDG